MKIQILAAVTLSVALSACSDDNKSTPIALAPNDPPVTNPPVTNPPVTNPPVNQSAEDQLLNQGTSTSPATGWACSIPNDEDAVVFGFYGSNNGIVGFLAPTGALNYAQAPYVFDAAGNAQYSFQTSTGVIPIIMAAPNFIDGTTYTSTVTFGTDVPFQTRCQLLSITTTPTSNNPAPTQPSNDGNALEAQLINRGTQANPAEGWNCSGILLGFYGSGQGRVGLSDGNNGGSFNVMQYSINSAGVVEITANGVNGTMSSIQFSDANNFSTVIFDGEDTISTNCTRFELSLANSRSAVSKSSDLSTSKDTRLSHSAVVNQMPTF